MGDYLDEGVYLDYFWYKRLRYVCTVRPRWLKGSDVGSEVYRVIQTHGV